jgi:hypothetical protein
MRLLIMCEASAMQLDDDGTRIDLYRCFVLAMNGVKEGWGAVEAVDRVYDFQKAADFRQGGRIQRRLCVAA